MKPPLPVDWLLDLHVLRWSGHWVKLSRERRMAILLLQRGARMEEDNAQRLGLAQFGDARYKRKRDAR